MKTSTDLEADISDALEDIMEKVCSGKFDYDQLCFLEEKVEEIKEELGE